MPNQIPPNAGDSSSLLTAKVESPADSLSTHSYQHIPHQSVEQSAEQTSQHGASSLHSSVPDKPALISHQKDFFLDWTLKILGLACAILFGIWAPISFKLTSDSNRESDQTQKAMFEQLGDMQKQAGADAQKQNAAATHMAQIQNAAATAMAQVQHQLDQIGKLRAWQFCDAREDQISACRTLSLSVKIEDLVAQLGGFGSTTMTLTIDTYSAAPSVVPGTSQRTVSLGQGYASSTNLAKSHASGAGVSKDLLAIILGSVFSVIVVVGLVVGLLARRRQWKRLNDSS